jgi:hypothetical protein
VTLPGAYAPASMALRVIRARKSPHLQHVLRHGALLSSHFLSNNIKIKKDRTIIIFVVLYGCHPKVLGRILGPEREEVIWGCRILHSGELHNLCYSPNVIEVTE